MMKKKQLLPYLLLLPTVLFITVLVYYPIVRTFLFSLQSLNLAKPAQTRFVFFGNYARVLTSNEVFHAFLVSSEILLLVLITTLILGLIFAFILGVQNHFKALLIALMIMPWAFPPIVNGVIWRLMFHPQYGLLNLILSRLGLITAYQPWLVYDWFVIVAAALVLSWRLVPLSTLILLAALQTIPRELYEAADIDGCSRLLRLSRITLPLLRPAIGIVMTLTSIAAINVFDELIALTGFSGSTRSIMIEIYLVTFRFLDFGRGTALTFVVMVITAGLSYWYIRRIYRQVRYL